MVNASLDARGSARRASQMSVRNSAGRARRTRDDLRLHRKQTLALQLLAGELTGATNCLRLLPRPLFRRFLIMAAQFHLAEDPLALHLFLERFEGLVDIVVADENLHGRSYVARRCLDENLLSEKRKRSFAVPANAAPTRGVNRSTRSCPDDCQSNANAQKPPK